MMQKLGIECKASYFLSGRLTTGSQPVQTKYDM
jgi:hypothetical protein